jgi:hypothetical protein
VPSPSSAATSGSCTQVGGTQVGGTQLGGTQVGGTQVRASVVPMSNRYGSYSYLPVVSYRYSICSVPEERVVLSYLSIAQVLSGHFYRCLRTQVEYSFTTGTGAVSTVPQS